MSTEGIEQVGLKNRVLGEQVSQILSDAILEGILKGGDRLVETELQKKFGVSRSPLREAYRDLEKKGLVTIVPRRGTCVRKITRRDIEENFPVRSVLEGLAARQACGKMSGKDKKRMLQSLRNMERAVREGAIKLYWKNHLLFHDVFISASRNEVLITILKTLRMHSMWFQFSYQYYREDLQKSLSVHQKIYDLFQDDHTDPAVLDGLVKNHIDVAFERFIEYLEAQEPSHETY
jgi:DNA-binding GntR family transcriptional regulator